MTPTRAQVAVHDLDPAATRAIEMALVSAHDVGASSAEFHRLPEMVFCPLSSDGLRAMESLRDRWPRAEFILIYETGDEGDIARALREGAFYCLGKPLDPLVVRAVAGRCLEIASLREATRREQQRRTRELAEASAAQLAMLPAPEARLPRAGVSVAMRCRPCSDVGGDLVDYAPADGCAALLIADVAGHGISAAMLTTVVKSAFRAAGAARYEPQAVVTAVMDGLAPFGQEKFVTLLSAVVDRAAKTIRYANAGHPPGWIFRRGEVIDELNPTGPLILPGGGLGEIAVARVALPEHAGVLLFTDGLTDAVAPGGQRFDESRLREVVGRFPGGGAALLDGILASADAFCAGEPPRDDITLLTATMGLPGLS